jgi:serine/threonine protein kinase
MRVTEGTRLGHYEIQGAIGAGGMGEVYRARDTRLQRSAAIKIITDDADADRVRRLEREALSASALNHPNILTVYEFGVHDGLHYIATELVEGETLRDMIRRGPIALDSALDIAAQIAAALDAAHAAGIVHRDIKPENVMVRPDGYVKVLDFGIAKLLESSAAAADSNTLTLQTMPGVLVGTVGYMAPEQVRGLPADHRADVWSFAVVLHEMLTGRSPFAGATSSDIIAAILERTPPTLVAAGITAPAELERIIARALAKERDDRYQSMKEIAADLRAVAETQKFHSRNQKADSTTQPVPPIAPWKRPVILAASVVATAWLGWIGWSWTRPPAGHVLPPTPGAALPVPAPAASASPKLEYWLTVEPPEGGPQAPVAAAVTDAFTTGSRFRFNFTNPQPGHVYVLNEGKGSSGEPLLTVLYPMPSVRDGSARVPAGEVASTPTYVFRNRGLESIWVVWSVKPHPELDRVKRWVTKEHQGLIKDAAEAATVLGLLIGGQPGTGARTDAQTKRTVLTGDRDVLVHRAELRVGGGGT